MKQPSLNNQLWRAAANFATKMRDANRAQVEDALIGAKQGMNDFALSANERAYYKSLATILRKELKKFSPKAKAGSRRKPNPASRKPGEAPYKHKGYEIWNMGGRHWAYRKPRTDSYIGQFKTVAAAMNAIDKLKKGNPKMAKKKRTAKQLANDRRLGRMAKARAKKKGKKKAKTARRKARKRNVVRKGFPKKVAKRKALKKSHLWLVFKCKGNSVSYLTMRAGKPAWSTDKGKGMLFRTSTGAQKAARDMAKKRISSGANVGVINSEISAAVIKRYCAGK